MNRCKDKSLTPNFTKHFSMYTAACLLGLSLLTSSAQAAPLNPIHAASTTLKADIAATPTSVMVQDFEKPSSLPTVWVVNIPNENAAVQLSDVGPFEGNQCLSLHYHFTGVGDFQYLGIPHKVHIQAPIHQVTFRLKGDNSGCGIGLRLTDADGETHQYKGGIIDFSGWKEVVFDLDAAHETWDGDKNGKLEYPISSVTLDISQPTDKAKLPVESDLYFDAIQVSSEKSAAETLGAQISVVSPAYCADIQGKTFIKFSAPGFKNVTVKCWKQGPGFGSDSTVATVPLNAQGDGAFVFPADSYPHGPVTMTLSSNSGTLHDNCYLQLYNKGGVSWNEGMPKTAPPAAKGMALVFADDFNGPLSISSADPKARYYDHKPPNGSQDFSTLPFTGHDSPNNPFTQVGTYLRIRASEKAHSAGLLSSLKNDGTGIKAKLPCYFEARFLGPNAIGTWPAFWLMTDYLTDYKILGDKTPVDELDIIEAYGGEGPHEPNSGDKYQITPHAWNQGEEGKVLETTAYKAMHNPASPQKAGIPSTWFEAFHTYGCKITATDTIYYCDNIEMGRHQTLPISKKYPFFFMINLATGGGWPVDLFRYAGLADMYVDYVRVYQQSQK